MSYPQSVTTGCAKAGKCLKIDKRLKNKLSLDLSPRKSWRKVISSNLIRKAIKLKKKLILTPTWLCHSFKNPIKVFFYLITWIQSLKKRQGFLCLSRKSNILHTHDNSSGYQLNQYLVDPQHRAILANVRREISRLRCRQLLIFKAIVRKHTALQIRNDFVPYGREY